MTYQWNRDGQPLDGANQSTYTTDANLSVGSYNYTVTVINPLSGCEATSGAVAANVVADPTVVILGAADVCEGAKQVAVEVHDYPLAAAAEILPERNDKDLRGER